MLKAICTKFGLPLEHPEGGIALRKRLQLIAIPSIMLHVLQFLPSSGPPPFLQRIQLGLEATVCCRSFLAAAQGQELKLYLWVCGGSQGRSGARQDSGGGMVLSLQERAVPGRGRGHSHTPGCKTWWHNSYRPTPYPARSTFRYPSPAAGPRPQAQGRDPCAHAPGNAAHCGSQRHHVRCLDKEGGLDERGRRSPSPERRCDAGPSRLG